MGVDIVLKSPVDITITQLTKNNLRVTNNKAEYRPSLNRLRFAQGLDVKLLIVYMDLLLTVNQVNSHFEVIVEVL